MKPGNFIATAFGCTLVSMALAQPPAYQPDKSTKLLNMDTPMVLGKGMIEGRAEVRAFGGDEKQAYGTVEIDGGFGNGFGFVLRSSFSSNRTFHGSGFDIRHGGSDFEGMVRYAIPQMPGFAIEAGASLPSTPAQNRPFGTGQAVYE